jgi:RNA polymerase sigma-70 factor (sigma-E family)
LTGRSEEFRAFALDRSLRLHQSAYLLCGDWHLAHDLVQDTLVKVYRHWSRVRRADSPDAYVRRILINEARDRWRRRDKAVSVADVGAEREVPLVVLPHQQRATVILRYLEGLSQAETAQVLGCSEGTVKSQSSRALATLRKYLDRTEARS